MTEDALNRPMQALRDLLHARKQRSLHGVTLETCDMEMHACENARRIVAGEKKLLPYPPPSRRRSRDDD